jgi:hypothetical protein
MLGHVAPAKKPQCVQGYFDMAAPKKEDKPKKEVKKEETKKPATKGGCGGCKGGKK